jgi:hypothetical protein
MGRPMLTLLPAAAIVLALFADRRAPGTPRQGRLQGTTPGWRELREAAAHLRALGVDLDVIEAWLGLINEVPPHIWSEDTQEWLQDFADQHGLSLRPRPLWGDFWEIPLGSSWVQVPNGRRPGPYLIRAEPWSPWCLEAGVGPCSSLQHGDEAEWVEEELPGRLQQYRKESRLRLVDPDKRPGEVDAPPPGGELLSEAWVPVHGSRTFDALQLTLWKIR